MTRTNTLCGQKAEFYFLIFKHMVHIVTRVLWCSLTVNKTVSEDVSNMPTSCTGLAPACTSQQTHVQWTSALIDCQ